MQNNYFSLKETRDILQQKSLRLLVVGDGCRDYTHYGNVNRISQEAPVPIFDRTDSSYKLGMAFNVVDNLRSLGIEHINVQAHEVENKHRYIDMDSKHQVFRVDEKNDNCIVSTIDLSGEYDAVIISDYDKGVLSYEDIEHIIKSSSVPVYIDTKKTDLARFSGSIVKINEIEYKKSISLPDQLFVTCGGNDILHIRNGNIVKTYPVNQVDLYDTTGAGDSFLSAFTVYHLLSGDIDRAVSFATRSSQITVTKFGVYAPTLEEICQQD